MAKISQMLDVALLSSRPNFPFLLSNCTEVVPKILKLRWLWCDTSLGEDRVESGFIDFLPELLKILQRQPRIATTKLCVQDFLHCQPHFLACVLPFEPFVILIGD